MTSRMASVSTPNRVAALALQEFHSWSEDLDLHDDAYLLMSAVVTKQVRLPVLRYAMVLR
jgi:hypothetical protein